MARCFRTFMLSNVQSRVSARNRVLHHIKRFPDIANTPKVCPYLARRMITSIPTPQHRESEALLAGESNNEERTVFPHPSLTRDVYKIYAESFQGETHLRQILEEAQNIMTKGLESISSSMPNEHPRLPCSNAFVLYSIHFHIRRAIIHKGAVIPPDSVISYVRRVESDRFTLTDESVVVITQPKPGSSKKRPCPSLS